MKKIYSLYLLVIALFIQIIAAAADDFPEKPYPSRLVNDFTGFLTENERNELEQKLVNFDRETSTQIAIVIVPDLGGYDKADYAVKLGRKWGIGQQGKNNGILILVKPKTATERGEVFIAPGYGLEGAVPDAIAKRIVENEVLPSFSNGNYYKGLDKAVNTLMGLTKGEFTADEYQKRTQNKQPVLPMILMIAFVVLFSIIGRFRRARHYSVGHNIPFWLALTMLSSSRSSHSGGFGNFSSGGGSFGGFGGFGGGSFGGGGAGGSW